ncbi:DUF2971 domain-containing protein [Pseudomonas rustica]
MERHLYRFRTADRLLGTEATKCKDAVPGELENLEIYFAPPEQLNDPLEGYREIYWSGDQIVWMNFFRHYLLILALRSWQVDDVELGSELPKELPIGHYPARLEGMFQEAYSQMDELLQLDSIFNGYAAAFAKDENKHYKPQLSHYLYGMHSRFLNLVMSVNAVNGMTGFGAPEILFQPSENPENHHAAISEIETFGDVGRVPGMHQRIALNTSSFAIKTFNVLPSAGLGLQELIASFTFNYLDQIERLMHPKWYVACFMKECENSAIWGSYGDNHRGICLKYRIGGPEPRLNLEMNKPVGYGYKGIATSFQPMPFEEVFYDREHTEIDFFRSLGNVPNEALGGFWYSDGSGNLSSTSEWFKTDSVEIRDKHWRDFNFALTSKLPQWESEKEYRLVLNSHMDISDKKHRILKYRFSSLAGVIFGIKTPLEHKLKTIRIIKAHCEQAGIEEFPFYQAFYDPETKSIQHGLLHITIHDADVESDPTGPETSSAG